MRSRTIDLDGPVHFADFGGRGPTMVLVHGLGGSHANWAAVGPALAERARVAAHAIPGVGERFLRWRAAYLGPEALVRQTLALCCADATCVTDDMVALHVALARERQAMPWAQTAFLQAARSIIALLARRRQTEKMIDAIRAPTLVVQGT